VISVKDALRRFAVPRPRHPWRWSQHGLQHLRPSAM